MPTMTFTVLITGTNNNKSSLTQAIRTSRMEQGLNDTNGQLVFNSCVLYSLREILV